MSKEAKKLNKEFLGENDIMIRRPSDDEQRMAKIVTSDYQISSITIQSSILFSLDMLDRVYRSKNATVSMSTSNKIKKYKSIIDKLLYNLNFINNTDDFFNFIEKDKIIFEDTGVELKLFLKSQKKWENVMSQDHILPIIVPFVKLDPNSPDYTEAEVSECKRIFNIIRCHFEDMTQYFETPALYFNTLTLITSFHSIFNDDLIKDDMEDILDYSGSLEDYKVYIHSLFTSKDRGSIKRHTQTIINEKCLENQKNVLKIIQDNNLGEQLSLDSFKSYLKMFKPHIFEVFSNTCGIRLEDYETFDELCDALYSPENLNNLRNSLKVRVRARCSGDLRKGAELIIDQKRFLAKRENAKKRLGCEISNFNYENEAFILEQKKKECSEKESHLSKYQSRIDELKKRIKEARTSGMDKIGLSLLRNQLNDVTKQYKLILSSFKECKRTYKELFRNIQNKKRAYDTIKYYENLELEMYNNMKETRHNDDYYEISILEQRTKEEIIKEDKIPYFTWQFICYGMSMKTADLLCETLEKHLNEGSGICGEAGYINAAAFMVGEHLGKPMTQFFIDYPKSAAIYKAFKKNKNLSEILLKGFSDCMNIPIICIKDETKFNIPMEVTLKEDTYTWDNYWN